MRKTRKILWTLVSVMIVSALLISACGQQPEAPVEEPTEVEIVVEETSPPEEEEPTQEESSEPEDTADEETSTEDEVEETSEEGEASLEDGKFALVLTGPTDDNSWNEAGYDALMALKERGVETVYAEQVPYPDTERLMREFIDQGYQMIVGHSFGHKDAAFALAEEYPGVNFAWGGGTGETAENVADYDQPFYQAAYLVGIIAGHVSETGKLGAIYGFDIPVCHAMGEALLLGAQTVNEDAELTATGVGDWYDISKAKEAALSQADTGVDYWVTCGQGPTFGSIEAAKERGGYATGYVGNMTEAGPDVVLTNIMWNLEPMFVDMMESTLNGTFDAPYYEYGIKENALDLHINPDLADIIPQEALDQVEEVKAQIKNGEFEVPFIPE